MAVDRSVYLQSQARLGAVEIKDIRPNRVLPPEAEAGELTPA
jgi:hypothetical protein